LSSFSHFFLPPFVTGSFAAGTSVSEEGIAVVVVAAFKDEPQRICIFSKLNGAFAADMYCIRREEKRGVECVAFEHHLSHAILRLGYF